MFNTMVQELKIRNDSKKTIDAYIFHNKKFLDFTKKTPQYITSDDVKNYILHLMKKQNSTRTIRLAISALSFYYTKILKRNVMKNIHRPKLEQTIPQILEKENILKMIDATKNLKHKLLINLLYSSGVRISEALKLKKEDINIEKKMLFVKQGKGKKDRQTILSERFLKDYLIYEKDVSNYIFESSYNKNQPISIRTAQLILENAAIKAGLKTHTYPHMMRRSFATHLYENGTKITDIQALLGHSDIKTTLIYTRISSAHLQNIASPID